MLGSPCCFQEIKLYAFWYVRLHLLYVLATSIFLCVVYLEALSWLRWWLSLCLITAKGKVTFCSIAAFKLLYRFNYLYMIYVVVKARSDYRLMCVDFYKVGKNPDSFGQQKKIIYKSEHNHSRRLILFMTYMLLNDKAKLASQQYCGRLR